MSSLPKVGVIGTGRFGENHVRLYGEIEQCELVGIYDLNPSRGNEIADKYNTKLFGSAESLLDALDMVSVVTPTATHYEVAKKPLERGIKTLIEKPICTTLEDADDLIRLAAQNSTTISVGFLERYNGAVRKLFEELNGAPISRFEAVRVGTWVGRKVTADVVSDLMVHDIDLLNLLHPVNIKDIKASGERIESEFYDRSDAGVLFEDNLLAMLISDRANDKRHRSLTVATELYEYELDMMNQAITKDLVELEITKTEPLRDELTAFVTNSETPPADALAGRQALEMVLRIQAAMEI